MKRFIVCLLISILVATLVVTGILHPQTSHAQGGPTITPSTISAQICGTDCLTQAVQITLPPPDHTPLGRLDVMLVIDASSSMNDEIDSVQRSALDIAQNLRGMVDDTRFAAGMFADYDADLPWELLTDFTTDINSFNTAIGRIHEYGGHSLPESYTRALWESSQLSWRDDAVRLIVLFTDDEPHYDDPGRDEQDGTADDLNYNAVLAGLEGQGIRVISVNSGGDSGAEKALQQAAATTNGRYFALGNAEDIPQQVVSLIEQELAEYQLAFVSQQVDQQGWITHTPEAFDYPPEGGTLTVVISFCPKLMGLGSNTYTIPLDLKSANEVFGSVTIQADYVAECVNLTIPDHAGDDGSRCSDINGAVFWESPAIVVRQTPDNGRDFEFPMPRREAYVYVEVHNTGQLDASGGTLLVYASPSVMVADFPANWQEIGRTPVTLSAGQTAWYGPFAWTPQNNVISLRATVETARDPITRTNDYACDDNIAQVNRVPVFIHNYSIEPGHVAAMLPVVFRSPPEMDYEALDLLVNTREIPSGGYMVLRGNEQFLTEWEAAGGWTDGFSKRAENEWVITPGHEAAVMGAFIRQPGVTTAGQMIIASDNPADIGNIQLGLRAEDRIVTGVTLNVEAPLSILGQEDAELSNAPLLPIVIPLILFLGLLVIAAGVYFTNTR
ncbi:MAG: VWA domain-containing protein [Anaerolineae bacterium]|nr:VWA domain-containing protein [Anaerolineae bacterium]